MAAGCTPPTAKAELQTIELGKQIHHTRACDSGHALDAVGSRRTYAPTHNHLRATAEQRIHAPNYRGKAKTAAEYIRGSIVEPKAYVVDGYEHVRFGMPSFADLSEKTRKSGTISHCISREDMCHFYMICPLVWQTHIQLAWAWLLLGCRVLVKPNYPVESRARLFFSVKVQT